MKVRDLFETDDFSAKPMDLTAEQITDIIQSKCSKFVDACKSTNGLVLRGVSELSGSVSPFAVGKIRHDRHPIYMNIEIHDLSIEAMNRMGYPANRGNSLFCTTANHVAADWGRVHVIFVEDGWVGTAFRKVKRGYAFTEIYNEGTSIAKRDIPHKQKVDEMIEVIEDLEPIHLDKSSELAEIIRDKYEDFLISGKTYYALRLSSSMTEKVLSNLGISL